MNAAKLSPAAALATAALLATSSAAFGQSYSVDSVASVDLGQIAAGSIGPTRFQVDPASGALSKLTGAGARVSGGSGNVLVTVSCAQQGACNNKNPVVTVTTIGSPTKRFAALEAFTISTAGASAVIADPPSASGSSITFTLQPIGKNSSKTFWIGYDLTVEGDNSGLPTGLSNAALSVTVTKENGQGPSVNSGTVSATVFRTLTASVVANLAFGIVSRPRQGIGTVSLAPGETALTVSGDGVVALAPSAPNVATIGVTGEGGQTVAVTVPGTFTMSGPGGAIVVTTLPSITGAMVLPGSLGGAGSVSVDVGGTFELEAETPTGSYSGSFPVIFQYN